MAVRPLKKYQVWRDVEAQWLGQNNIQLLIYTTRTENIPYLRASLARQMIELSARMGAYFRLCDVRPIYGHRLYRAGTLIDVIAKYIRHDTISSSSQAALA